MGFFKQASLIYRANKIAGEFSILRRDQFDSTVRCIEERLGHPVAISQKTLGGDADRALKGYQLFISTAFFAEHQDLIPASEFEELRRHLSAAVIGSAGQGVSDFFAEFVRYAKDPAKQLVRVSRPVANYIASQSDAIAGSIVPEVTVAQLLPIFICNSQMVLASIFGDHKTARELESEMQTIRQALTEK